MHRVLSLWSTPFCTCTQGSEGLIFFPGGPHSPGSPFYLWPHIIIPSNPFKTTERMKHVCMYGGVCMVACRGECRSGYQVSTLGLEGFDSP